MPKFTNQERIEIQNMVANLSIKRIPDSMIIKHIFNETAKTLSSRSLWNIRKRLQKESYSWYTKLREGEYEYIHEFKERIDEIVDLQKRHYKIIDANTNNAGIQQVSLAALHKLNVTLSNYYDVIPYLTDKGLRQTPKAVEAQQQQQIDNTIRISPAGHRTKMPLVQGCQCILEGIYTDIVKHIECHWCGAVWCYQAIPQEWCPNPECKHGIKGNEFEPYDSLYKWVKCGCGCGMWFKTQEILEAHLASCLHANNKDNNDTGSVRCDS